MTDLQTGKLEHQPTAEEEESAVQTRLPITYVGDAQYSQSGLQY